jgi:hypothetical protein
VGGGGGRLLGNCLLIIPFRMFEVWGNRVIYMGADTISSLDYIFFFLCAQGLPHPHTRGVIRSIIYTHKYIHIHTYVDKNKKNF